MTRPELTAERLDAMLTGRRRDQIIWTAGAIGARIGTSADFVRDKLAHMPGTPVKQIAGRYCAIEADLIDFFRKSA